jgi:phosphoglycolate phosphatase-like HAD superfamily hydrolase
MSRIRMVILDFDGVIVESNDIKTRAFEHVFSRFPEHADVMMAYHHAHVSVSRFDKFQYLVTERLGLPIDHPVMQELADAFSAETRRRVIACPMVPGAAEFLEHVTARVPVFLASVTPQADLEHILEARGLLSCFSAVYGCPPWTKARAIEHIIAGDVDGVVFVGDSVGDQRAAQATGVAFVARDSGLPFDDPQPWSGRDLRDVLVRISPDLP